MSPPWESGMAIRKQEFYEGAALHLLARTGSIRQIRYEPPLFILNDDLLVLLKYSTKNRSPWGFTFMPDEQTLLLERSAKSKITIGLICGADGVAAFGFDDYLSVTSIKKSAVHFACYRKHGEHYEVCGPDGSLQRKVPPLAWQRILRESA